MSDKITIADILNEIQEKSGLDTRNGCVSAKIFGDGSGSIYVEHGGLTNKWVFRQFSDEQEMHSFVIDEFAKEIAYAVCYKNPEDWY